MERLDANQFEIVEEPAAKQSSGLQPIAADEVEILPAYADGRSPEFAINKSPLTVEERSKLSLGNKAGKLKYLKGKFEDARMNAEDEFVVKQNGAWHRVDAEGLGDADPWETSKRIYSALTGGKTSDELEELKKDFADFSGDVLPIAGAIKGAGIGAAKAAAVSGPAAPAAAVVGSVIGGFTGAFTGEGIRTSLGRLEGTYEAAPEEQLSDMAKEGLLAAGGEVLGVGAKFSYDVGKRAFSKLGATASNYAKDAAALVWGDLSDAGQWSVRRAMDHSESVFGKADEVIKQLGPKASRLDAPGAITAKQNEIIEKFAEGADTALKASWNKNMGELIKATPDNFQADVSAMVVGTFKEMQEAGWGRFVPHPGGKGITFELLPDEEIARRAGIAAADVPKVIGPETRKGLEQVVQTLGTYGNAGVLKGKSGAKKLVDLKAAVNQGLGDLFSERVPDSVQRTVAKVKKSFDTRVGQTFADVGAAPKYIELNNVFASHKDAVKLVKDAVKNGSQETLVKQLVSKTGSNQVLKGEAAALAELMGESGHKMVNDLLDYEASKGFTNWLPKSFKNANSAGSIVKVAATPLMQTNPRAIAAQIKYTGMAVDWLKALGPDNVDKLMRDPQKVQAFFSTTIQAADSEEQRVQELLQQAGVR